MEMFQKAVADTEELLRTHYSTAKGPTSFNPDVIPARQRFLARRVKLLRNLLRWQKVVGDQFGVRPLVTRLVDDCILGAAESGWDVGGKEIVKSVCVR
jgi:GC-rich sequence DNA-binding factor